MTKILCPTKTVFVLFYAHDFLIYIPSRPSAHVHYIFTIAHQNIEVVDSEFHPSLVIELISLRDFLLLFQSPHWSILPYIARFIQMSNYYAGIIISLPICWLWLIRENEPFTDLICHWLLIRTATYQTLKTHFDQSSLSSSMVKARDWSGQVRSLHDDRHVQVQVKTCFR